MNIVKIEENVKQIINKIIQNELNQQDFIYELLLAYGHRSQSIGRVRNGERNLAEDKENTVFWKRQIYFKIAKQHDLHGLIDQMKNEKRTDSNKIRFLIVTDFKTLLAVDTKTQDTLDVPFNELAKKFDFFLPWAGMEKAVYQGENPADVKAAEKLAKLFDEIKADNFDEDDLNNKDNLHQLNIFLSRLLFCYFAEDTEIFKDKQFTSAISKSNEDGSDLSSLIGRLFKVLNQSSEDRETDLPDYLADFPYVNGGLFKDDIQVPKFTRKSRRILIECGKDLDWSDINPDIFGSMFQAVVHTEQRSTMGQHYTSVPNIMKVIEPLFLNDLYEELEKNQDSVNKLLKLQQRLGQLKIFDPACGSGNFLIIAYKELRKFEMELLKRIQELELEKTGQFSKPFSVIQVSQFYGIEIDDFAHEVAILSLWLVEHQMNLAFRIEFGEIVPALPLKISGNVICNNATQVDWLKFCEPDSPDTQILIIGNPPFAGSRKRNSQQSEDLKLVFNNKNYKLLDYVSAWFYKGASFISKTNAKLGFVSTNSITQGEQVSLLWPRIFNMGVEISWAHQSFKWKNNAKHNAAVTVVIIGIEKINENKSKILYSESLETSVGTINPNLTESSELIVSSRKKPLSNIPDMCFGNMPADGGKLLFNEEEKTSFIQKEPLSKRYFKELISAREFINGKKRYCLWFADEDLDDLYKIKLIRQLIEEVKIIRQNSSRPNLASIPHLFAQITQPKGKNYILIPRHSSENRDYIPMGFFSEDYIAHDSCLIIPDASPALFAILNSRMHMVWVRAVAGRIKTDFRYSKDTVYNNFPIPTLTKSELEELSNLAFEILSIRENDSSKCLADLYSKATMPNDLRNAHIKLDKYVDSIYQKKSQKQIKSDECRLSILSFLYNKMSIEG
ncbi:class I SAM-dependent DNA methyltransferase [Acinetobacter indicus]|uniref:class I SAM-dependent DNA methyltransferase n=1 Tax=Acinetobacter indicus TaxID=756892 RepID=UPI0025757CC2|nr:DNA methyltransferase [Acinetobacter indicus]MDM1493745.1 class I SAM-dependent DNA methyltransferase [Acinetobacter indicus]